MTTLPTPLSNAIASGSVDHALGATIAHFGCQAGTVHFLRNGVLKLAASSGIPPHIAEIVSTVPIGKGIAGLAAERKEPITICNLQTDTSGQARPAAKTTGMEGSLAVPMLTADGTLHGVLGIAKATAYDWPEDETKLVLAVASEFSHLAEVEPV
jgi:signal transduction protein with GAF and PtsI domain